MRIQFVAIALFACSAVACGSSGAPKQPTAGSASAPAPAPASAASAAHAELFAAAGYNGMVELAMWPDSWSKLPTLLESVRSHTPAPIRGEVAQGLGMLFPGDQGSAWQVVRTLVGGWQPAADAVLPTELANLDPSRPIILSLFAPMKPEPFEPMARDASRLLTGAHQPPAPTPAGIVNRLVLPTAQPQQLMAELRPALDALGTVEQLAAGEVGVRAERYAIVAAQRTDHLLIIAIAGVNLQAWPLSDWSKLPTGTAIAADALFTADEPALVRVFIRSKPIAQGAPMLGMRMVMQAVMTASPDFLVPLMAIGVSEVLVSDAYMHPQAMLNVAALYEVPAALPGSLHAAFWLTDAGHKGFAADPTLWAGAPVALKDLRWADIAAALPPHPTLAKLAGGDQSELLAECGFGCSLYSLGPNGMYVLAAFAAELGWPTLFAQLDGLQQIQLTGSGPLLIAQLLAPSQTRFSATAGEPASVPLSEAELCYHRAQERFRLGLHAVGNSEPALRPQLFTELASAAGADEACIRKSPELSARLDALTEFVTNLAATPPPEAAKQPTKRYLVQ